MLAGITLMLALSVYQLVINDKLPTTSDAVPLVGKFHQFVYTISYVLKTLTDLWPQHAVW